MPRLILLNGPPGVGKSTISRLYVDDHPGVLNLDIDQLTSQIGGARSAQKLALARSDALALAGAHLRAGHDVLVPQYVGRVTELERFEQVASSSGAAFLHVVLMADRAAALERFAERGRTGVEPYLQEIHESLAGGGGTSAVGEMYDSVADVVRARLTSVLVASEAGAAQQTYKAVAEVLARDIPPTPPRGVAVVLDGERVLVIERRRQGVEYAVLPGGGVEPGETAAEAAVRELLEETSLSGRAGAELWHRVDDGREATYYRMDDVRGTAVLSGEEAMEHAPDNSFVLSWVTADDLDRIRLQPAQIRAPLADLLGKPREISSD